MMIFEHKGDFSKGAIITVNKPEDWSSFDVVNKIKYKITNVVGERIKVGHTGTLDPLATGLLIVCTGKYTKKISELQGLEKEYLAELKLGETTPSFDRETSVDKNFPTNHITQELVLKKLPNFLGNIRQVPPLYSAVKVDGERAYRIARNGEMVTLKPKNVYIKALTLISFHSNNLVLNTVCGKGTYIRALARDLGTSLKSGAYLTKLQRIRIGNYLLKNAFKISDCMEEIEKFH